MTRPTTAALDRTRFAHTIGWLLGHTIGAALIPVALWDDMQMGTLHDRFTEFRQRIAAAADDMFDVYDDGSDPQ